MILYTYVYTKIIWLVKGIFYKKAKGIFVIIFFCKCKHYIIQTWFITKTILILQKHFFWGCLKMVANQTSCSWLQHWSLHWSLIDRYPGLISVFWPILTMPLFGSSQLVLWFTILPVPLISLRGSFWILQLLLVSPSSSFFSSLVRSKYLSLYKFSLIFTRWFAEAAKSTRQQVLFFLFFFLLTITKSVFLVGIRWSVCISKSQKMLYLSFSRTDSGLCILWLNFNVLQNSPWITFPAQLCLIL